MICAVLLWTTLVMMLAPSHGFCVTNNQQLRDSASWFGCAGLFLGCARNHNTPFVRLILGFPQSPPATSGLAASRKPSCSLSAKKRRFWPGKAAFANPEILIHQPQHRIHNPDDHAPRLRVIPPRSLPRIHPTIQIPPFTHTQPPQWSNSSRSRTSTSSSPRSALRRTTRTLPTPVRTPLVHPANPSLPFEGC